METRQSLRERVASNEPVRAMWPAIKSQNSKSFVRFIDDGLTAR